MDIDLNRRVFLRALASGTAFLLPSGTACRAAHAAGGAPRTELSVEPSTESPTETPRLDAHAHVSSPRMLELLRARMGASPFLDDRDPASFVAQLDRDGIRRAIVLSEAYLMASDSWKLSDGGDEAAEVRAENDFLARMAARFPDRIVPFASVNPKRPYAEDEIDRCVLDLRMRGLKLHCWNGKVDVRDEAHRARLRDVLVCAAAHDLPVMVHAFNGSVSGFGRLDVALWARELILPIDGLRVCFAHLGGAGGFAPPVQAVFEALIEHLGPGSPAADRVFVDLSAVLMNDNQIGLPPTPPEERLRMAGLIDAWGLDRVLWGSDGIPGYLGACRAVWPLDRPAWRTVCRADGAAFLVGRAV